jgi:hypothetical protein
VDVRVTVNVMFSPASGFAGDALMVATRSPALPGGLGPGGVGCGAGAGEGVGLGFGAGGPGDGLGFVGGGGGGGVATRIAAVPTASPARAVIVAELVPDQVTFVWPLPSVRGAVSESSPLEAASVSGTFGAGTLPASVADVAIVSSSEPPPAGKSQLFGVRKTAAATPSAL